MSKSKKQTIFGIIMTLIMIVSMSSFATAVSAASESKTATLTTKDKIAYSGVISAKQCQYFGKNDSLSATSVKFLAKNKHSGIWKTDVSYEANAGESFSNNTTSKYSSSCKWELVLNPKGANAYGCIASGTIKAKS